MHAPFEPTVAAVASLLADPSRSRMLLHLLGGRKASASDLAAVREGRARVAERGGQLGQPAVVHREDVGAGEDDDVAAGGPTANVQ